MRAAHISHFWDHWPLHFKWPHIDRAHVDSFLDFTLKLIILAALLGCLFLTLQTGGE
jgi:hypothetical protein